VKSALKAVLSRFVLMAILSASPQALPEDWPHWRGPELNGISTEKGWTTTWPKEGPRQLWKSSVGTGFSSVAVAKARVFTLGNMVEKDTVFCFDAESGQELWKHSYPCPLEPIYHEGGPGSTPTVDEDKVYTISKRGQLFCFQAANGKVLWQKDLLEELRIGRPRWGFSGSPLVEGNLLILNVGGAGTAVDKLTGKVLWRSGTNAAGYSTPVPFTAHGEWAVALFSSKALLGVRVKDGQELWRYPWITKWDLNVADPVLVEDKLFISTMDRGCALLQLSASLPTVVWETKSMDNHFSSCVFLNGFFYGVNGNTDRPEKDFRCVDLAKGEVKWKHEGLGLGSLMAADGKLIILSERGELVVAAASSEEFKPLARAQVLGGKCWTVPVLANGRIYCRNAQGTLVCLDVRAPGSAQAGGK
jgi:outer membrane protein assembly factor BamB